MKPIIPILIASVFLILSACNDSVNKNEAETNNSKPIPQIKVPVFNADSAYSYVAYQTTLGPRTPGSDAQTKCAQWMLAELKQFCDTVYEQKTTVKSGDGKMLPCINLIGVINPTAPKRILFLTHWDSRPWADNDTKDKEKPIIAADDAGSGVGVLIEVARELQQQHLSANTGIDILFTDVEDFGRSEWGEESYCLGTQYWAHNPHVAGYKAAYGILLDMVGARNAQFPLEGLSSQFANDIQQKVWQAAGHAGYSSFFIYTNAAAITDDHVPVNRITGIKTIDIINLSTDPDKPFAPHWHTHADDLNIIEKTTLKAVGQTLLQTIYEEDAPAL